MRRGNRLEIQLILEAKSGGRSAEGLARSYQTVKAMSQGDQIELFRFIRDEYRHTLDDYLRNNYPEAYSDYIARRFNELPQELLLDVLTHSQFRRGPGGRILTSEVGGQVRRDIERLHGSTIRIDGQPVEVVAGPARTQFLAALPEDVDADFILKSLQEMDYIVDISRFPVSQSDLVSLTEELASRLAIIPL